MTVANAQKFIKRGLIDSELRARLNRASNPDEIQKILEEENLDFTPGEFDEAFHHALTECQTTDAANQTKEFKGWWDLLFQTF
ncbi:Nif11-like leader peptide family natural product precursor [Desulfatibacillum aliphaticivorans]|uniref:Nif11-like leader peptide family natural product precursor n=1 Tax=Desulfatibacillum aliphaticivorans TaxID=218208 RepID=UPI00040803AC|nr:Nif11-like leader peptide family natural product precursor [Desulfatibacillum aliphaticivorans]